MNRKHLLYSCTFLLCIFTLPAYSPTLISAVAYAEIQQPTAPTPPTKPTMERDKPTATEETKTPPVPKKESISDTINKPNKDTTKSTKPVDTTTDTAKKAKDIPDKNAEKTSKALPNFSTDSQEDANTNDKPKSNAEKLRPELKLSAYLPTFLLLCLIFILLTAVFYFYRKLKTIELTPPKPTFTMPQAKLKTLYEKIEELAPKKQNKIKNASLLEQLVKYDMETYGELRPTINYDEPYYIEQLIKKYGRGDQEKIHHAIYKFHENRNKR